MTSVCLVGVHEALAREVIGRLATDPDLDFVGEAATATEARARLPVLQPDVVVVQEQLPDGNGGELCRVLRARRPRLNALLLASHHDEQVVRGACPACDRGHIIKDVHGTQLVARIREVGSGHSLLDLRRVDMRTVGLDPNATEPAGSTMPEEPIAPERVVFDPMADWPANRVIANRTLLTGKSVKRRLSRLWGILADGSRGW